MRVLQTSFEPYKSLLAALLCRLSCPFDAKRGACLRPLRNKSLSGRDISCILRQKARLDPDLSEENACWVGAFHAFLDGMRGSVPTYTRKMLVGSGKNIPFQTKSRSQLRPLRRKLLIGRRLAGETRRKADLSSDLYGIKACWVGGWAEKRTGAFLTGAGSGINEG